MLGGALSRGAGIATHKRKPQKRHMASGASSPDIRLVLGFRAGRLQDTMSPAGREKGTALLSIPHRAH